MKFSELTTFDVAYGSMPWPWFGFDPAGSRFVYPSREGALVTQHYDGETVIAGPSFDMPSDVPLAAVMGIALSNTTVAIVANLLEQGVLLVATAGAPFRRIEVAAHCGVPAQVGAVTFSRDGKHLWLSAESADTTLLVWVDVDTLAPLGCVQSAPFPRPSTHELFVHPIDDAVLLLAACGQDGTFARVAGHAAGVIAAIETSLDGGAVPAGFVGFSSDGMRVHLVEADELRTHAWPGLQELSSVELADEFVSNFSGAVFGANILVDGQHEDTQADAVMRYDRAAIHGVLEHAPVPEGMWAGRLGPDAIVTVVPASSASQRGRARILRFTLPGSQN